MFDEDEIDTMKDECRSFYRAAQSSWSKIYRREDIDELIVLIVISQKIGIDESEGRFWTKLFGEIFDDGSISPVKFYVNLNILKISQQGIIPFQRKQAVVP